MEVKKGSSLTTFSKTYKPFSYPWAVDLTVKHEKAHWIEDEIDLSEDVTDWKNGKITKVEKEYITNILRLFTQSDVAVGQNYYDQFIPAFKNNEVRNMLGSFAAREGIHQRAYALLNDTLGLPDSEYHAFLEY
ncbi:ribonucleotide-diphosphate reductase subunit beta, partial [Francisella philomiragia]